MNPISETNTTKKEISKWIDLTLILEIDFVAHLYEHIRIGRIMLAKPLNKDVMHATIKVVWSFFIGLTIEELKVNTFLFTFPMQQEKNRVLEQQPWNIKGFHILVCDWPPSLSLREIDMKMSIFWVQIQGLPLKYITNKNTERIARKVGNFIQVEKVTSLGMVFRRYMRIQVEINVEHPLPYGFPLT